MPEPLSETQRAEMHATISAELVPYRIRFYLIITALILSVLIAAFSYIRGHDELQRAVNRITCSERALVIRATPLRPRAQTSGGKPLHYTRAQRREIRAVRIDLLGALPSANCPRVLP